MSFRVYYWIRLEQHINTAVDELEKGVNDETNTVTVMLRTLMYIVSTNSIGSWKRILKGRARMASMRSANFMGFLSIAA